MLHTEGSIGRYQVQRRLAHGGMGSLYLAHDPVLDRIVAVKLFHGDLDVPDVRDRFVHEARAVAALNHPHIVTIYDYGEYASQPFIVMEYIRGETLADVVRRKAEIPLVTKVRWLEELCSAVEYAHGRNIIHRDLKPANLMVDGHGRLKVLDFGIARMRGTLVSSTTAVLGTPGYMAPEQLRGGAIDHRSDLFSIGVVAYGLLAYREPFGGDTVHAITHAVLELEPPPLDDACPAVDPELAALVTRALQKTVARRVQSATELRDICAAVRRRLEAVESGTILVEPRRPTGPPARSGAADETVIRHPPTAALRMTPAGAPRRTGRSTAVRDRQTQVHAWLQLAREHLVAGETPEARDACLQALRLDPGNVTARDLLSAMPGADGSPPPADQPPALDADAVGAPASPVQPQATSGARSSSAAASSRRETTTREAHGAIRPEADPPAGGATATPVTPNAPRRSPSGAHDAPAVARRRDTRQSAPDERARRRVAAAMAAGSAAVLLLIVLLIAPWGSAGPGVAAQTLVVIDATPWATVTGLARGTGDPYPLPDAAATPLPLWLEPGVYRATLIGPPPASETRDVSFTVEPGAAVHVPPARFNTMSVDEYFRSYGGDGQVVPRSGEEAQALTEALP